MSEHNAAQKSVFLCTVTKKYSDREKNLHFGLARPARHVIIQVSCGLTTSVTGRRRSCQPQDFKLHPASYDFGDWATPRKCWRDFFARIPSPRADVRSAGLLRFQ